MGQAFAVGQKEQPVCPMFQPNQRKDIHCKVKFSGCIHHNKCLHPCNPWNTQSLMELNWSWTCITGSSDTAGGQLNHPTKCMGVSPAICDWDDVKTFHYCSMEDYLWIRTLYRQSLDTRWAKAMINLVTSFVFTLLMMDGCGSTKPVPAIIWTNLVAGIEVLVDSLARKMITHYMLLYTVEPLHSRHNWEATFCPI